MRRSEAGCALNHFDFTLLGQRSQAIGQALDHAVFPGVEFARIDVWLTESNAVFAESRCLVDDFGSMQQRFRRNAANIEANAAQRGVTLDQDSFQAQISGTKGGCITARASANHHHVAVSINALMTCSSWCRYRGLLSCCGFLGHFAATGLAGLDRFYGFLLRGGVGRL